MTTCIKDNECTDWYSILWFFFSPAFLWQLMRFTMLQLLKNLRSHNKEKEIADVNILNWANNKVRKSGKNTPMESFKVTYNTQQPIIISSFFLCNLSTFLWRVQDKTLSTGVFFLELLSSVEPRVVNWGLVTQGETGKQEPRPLYLYCGTKIIIFTHIRFSLLKKMADEDKKSNATYIISVARKLGCTIFLLPEDIMEVCWFLSLNHSPCYRTSLLVFI